MWHAAKRNRTRNVSGGAGSSCQVFPRSLPRRVGAVRHGGGPPVRSSARGATNGQHPTSHRRPIPDGVWLVVLGAGIGSLATWAYVVYLEWQDYRR